MIGPDSVAIVGWEEGHSGQVDSWFQAAGLGRVSCFVHPEDSSPTVDAAAALRGRAVERFDFPVNDRFKGRPILSATDWPAVLQVIGISRALVLLSDTRRRSEEVRRARRGGLSLLNAFHPTAIVMPEAVIGENVILHARAFVGYRASIGDGVIINTGAQVDHHTSVHECASIDPGAVIAGNVAIGARAQIHTGAVIINRIRIGEDAIVGAGAVVIRDVGSGAKVAGNPARRIG